MIEVTFEEKNEALVIVPGMKRLDALVANEFRTQATQRIGQHKVNLVVLDMSRVGFVDSSGLAALISILKSIPTGGHLRLCQANAHIKHLLSVTRLEKTFPVFADLAAALGG